MAMKKKAAAPEPAGESAPMWIVSFADLVTLLMSFFVVLYALESDGDKGKKNEVMAAIKMAFGPEPEADSTDPVDILIQMNRGKMRPPMVDNKGRSEDPAKGLDGHNPEVQTIRGKDITTGGKLLFEPGQVKLDAAGIATLKKIADLVRGHNNVLMVKGHVSSDELSLRPDDPNGMSLSYQRAQAVAEELIKMGIDRRVVRPVPCGSFEPLKTGVYDAAGLKNNRRVEVYTTDYTAGDFFPINTVPAAGTQEGAATEGAGSAPATEKTQATTGHGAE